MPKSSSPGSSTASARRYSSRISSSLSAPEKLDVTRRPAARVAPRSGPSPTIRRRRADTSARFDGEIDALVRDERRHDRENDWPGRRRVRMIEDRVDRGIHDRRLAIIVSADPARNVLRVGDKAPDAGRRRGVPPRQPPQHRAIHPAARERAHPRRSEVGVELIPRIPHRRMAVADVPRAPRRRPPLSRRSGSS